MIQSVAMKTYPTDFKDLDLVSMMNVIILAGRILRMSQKHPRNIHWDYQQLIEKMD